MVKVLFPSILLKITKEKKTEIPAKTLGEAIDKLVEKYGKPFKEKIFEESGIINRHLRFYIKGRCIPENNKLDTPLNDQDEIAILIIISGG